MSFISRLKQINQARGVETSVSEPDVPARFFIHIPKTAGTSFRNSVVDHFGQKRVLQEAIAKLWKRVSFLAKQS